MLSNTPLSFLSGVLAVNANHKNVTQFLTSNYGVVDVKLKIVNTGESSCTAIEMIDLDLQLLNVF